MPPRDRDENRTTHHSNECICKNCENTRNDGDWHDWIPDTEFPLDDPEDFDVGC